MTATFPFWTDVNKWFQSISILLICKLARVLSLNNSISSKWKLLPQAPSSDPYKHVFLCAANSTTWHWIFKSRESLVTAIHSFCSTSGLACVSSLIWHFIMKRKRSLGQAKERESVTVRRLWWGVVTSTWECLRLLKEENHNMHIYYKRDILDQLKQHRLQSLTTDICTLRRLRTASCMIHKAG